MGIFDPAPPTDFLLPWLRLPGLRLCVGMTTEDGAIVSSEDLGARQLTINGAPKFASTDRGIGYIILNGTTDFLSVADAVWNSPLGYLTAFCVHKPLDTSTVQQNMLAKWGTGGNFSWHLNKATGLRMDVSGDGTTDTAISNGAPVAAWQLTVGQYEPGVALRVWNSQAGTPLATNTTSIPGALRDVTLNLDIGASRNSTNVPSNFYAGSIAVAGFCAALIDPAYITTLINHCRKFGVA